MMKLSKLSLIKWLAPLCLSVIACAGLPTQEPASNVVVATLTPDPNIATPTLNATLLAATPIPMDGIVALLDRHQISTSAAELPDIYPAGNYFQSFYVEQIEAQNISHRDVAYVTITIFPDDESATAYFEGIKAGVPTGRPPVEEGEPTPVANVDENEFSREDLSYLSRSFESAQSTGTDPGIYESYYVLHACNFVLTFEVINFFGEGLGSPLPEQSAITSKVVDTAQTLSATVCPDEQISWR